MLIVSRKVVDDAISVTLILTIYMVATSMALGSVAERDTSLVVVPAVIGILLALGKFYALRRQVGIPFGVMSLISLTGLIGVNYIGPILMAHSIQTDPADELGRRGVWFLVWAGIFLTVGLVWIERFRSKPVTAQGQSQVFLQSPMMVCILTLVLLGASGVHQYASAYMFVTAKPLGDFLGVVGLGTLLVLEILRLTKLRFGPIHIVVACLPLAALGYAIYHKSISASGTMGFDILVWPPVFCALMGIAYSLVANSYGWRNLYFVGYGCLLGAILTAGYSPNRPWDLNLAACSGTLVVSLLAYGLITWKSPICVLAIAILTLGLAQSHSFTAEITRWQLTPYGALAGVMGLGCATLYFVFTNQLHRAVRVIGFAGIAGFMYDFLPNSLTMRYPLVVVIAAAVGVAVWLRMRDRLGFIILSIPIGIKIYILSKQIAHWRFVILGFIVLAAGAILSLKKSVPKSPADRIRTVERHLP